MHTNDRHLLSLATAIHAKLKERSRLELILPSKQAFDAMYKRYRQYLTADSRDYLVTNTLQKAVYSEIDGLARDFRRFTADAVNRYRHTGDVTPAAKIFEDLKGIQAEFETVAFDSQDISVVTPRVTIEGLDLGDFVIHLEHNDLHEAARPYYIEALDPQPSAQNPDIVHPHVEEDVLCEGEASEAIGRALADGRLYDFFMLVASTLQGYNDASAYVRIDDWRATPCVDCGAGEDPGYMSTCVACASEVCDACVCVCVNCEDHFCTGCTRECEECQRCVCRTCCGTCARCGVVACEDHLDENWECDDCQRLREEEEEQEEEERERELDELAEEEERLAEEAAGHDSTDQPAGRGFADPHDTVDTSSA